jgi:uncharacterized paraquat-inducible protein A
MMARNQIDSRTFHGEVHPDDFASALVAEFNRGNLRAKKVGRRNQRIVQITSRPSPSSGGQTAISVHLTKVEDGVQVRIGQQEWLGIAASLGVTALSVLSRPLSILHRLDDLAQDLSSLQLTTRIWETLARTAEHLGASHELSDKLKRLTCEHCLTANQVGSPHCIACGAPLGPNQPVTCQRCGYILYPDEIVCPQCGAENTPG